jgi:hypothetical protein
MHFSLKFPFDDGLILFYFLLYYDILFSSHFSLSLCDICNFIISKVHYEFFFFLIIHILKYDS